jgi:raffinose/stachyose/melibiose transport system permease protein
MRRSRPIMYFMEIVMIAVAVIFFFPFYLVFVNSFKTIGDILRNSLDLPINPLFSNYADVWVRVKFPMVFMNSFTITAFSVIGIVLLSSMCAWRLVRHPTRINNILFFTFVAAMIIPFSAVMIPFVKVISTLNMNNSLHGIILMMIGFGTTISVFFYHGFIKSVPKEIEEAASIDGSNIFRLFWGIVFPLLNPITVTIMILNALWIWNEFLLPLLVLSDANLRTIPVAMYGFFSDYTTEWNYALAFLVLGMAPIIIFYFLLQKQIIQGVMAGSVKG